MTNVPEARLAREAEICYVTLAMVTDFDCWHPDHESVTADQIIQNLVRNAAMAKAVLRAAVQGLPRDPRTCECATALRSALVTAPELVPEKVKRDPRPSSAATCRRTRHDAAVDPGRRERGALTTSKPPSAARRRCWAAPRRSSRWRRRFSSTVQLVGVVGPTSAGGAGGVPGPARRGPVGLETAAARASTGRASTVRPEPPGHGLDGPDVFASFQSRIPEKFRLTQRTVFLGNIDPDAAARRARPGATARARRVRHHELLDRRRARTSCSKLSRASTSCILNDAEARQLPASTQPGQGGAPDPGHGAAGPWW